MSSIPFWPLRFRRRTSRTKNRSCTQGHCTIRVDSCWISVEFFKAVCLLFSRGGPEPGVANLNTSRNLSMNWFWPQLVVVDSLSEAKPSASTGGAETPILRKFRALVYEVDFATAWQFKLVYVHAQLHVHAYVHAYNMRTCIRACIYLVFLHASRKGRRIRTRRRFRDA